MRCLRVIPYVLLCSHLKDGGKYMVTMIVEKQIKIFMRTAITQTFASKTCSYSLLALSLEIQFVVVMTFVQMCSREMERVFHSATFFVENLPFNREFQCSE